MGVALDRYSGHQVLDAVLHNMLVVQSNLANTYQQLGRFQDALVIHRKSYAYMLESGENPRYTLLALFNLANTLTKMGNCAEVVSLLRDEDALSSAESVFGPEDPHTLTISGTYATALLESPGATRDDMEKAIEILEKAERTSRRVSGEGHYRSLEAVRDLKSARVILGECGISTD